MRTTVIVMMAVLLSWGCAASHGQPVQPLTDASGVDQVLDALNEVGQDLRDFKANVTLTETDNAFGESTARSGKVWYQKRPDGDARLRVAFETKAIGDSPAKPERLEYLLDKGWLIDRDYSKKIEANRQVLKPGEKINLLKLGEGPFPLPIGQDKEEVKRQFQVAKVASKPDDPVDTVHLQLTPNPGTQFERKFSAIDVWVDTKSHMPRRIQTLDKNQTITRITDLDSIQINGKVQDSDFTLPTINANEWQRHDEPFAD